MSQLFISGGQSIGASAEAQVLPMNIQDWFPLGSTGLIYFLSKGLSRVFSSTAVRKHQFFGAQPSLCPTLTSIHDYGGKTTALTMSVYIYICVCVCVCVYASSLSHVQLFVTSWTVAHQALLSMGIFQERILQWVSMPFSRGSSQVGDWTQVSCIVGGFFTNWTTGEAIYVCVCVCVSEEKVDRVVCINLTSFTGSPDEYIIDFN